MADLDGLHRGDDISTEFWRTSAPGEEEGKEYT